MSAESKYFEALGNLAGQVGERNARLLGIVTLGILAGRSGETIVQEVIGASGKPPLTEREVRHALARAETDTEAGKPSEGVRPALPKPRPPEWVREVAGFVPLMIRKGKGCGSFEALRAMSPQALPPVQDGQAQARAFLSRLFAPADFVYIGERYGTETNGNPVRILPEALDFLARNRPPPLLCVNPLSGEWGYTEDGKPSKRAQGCVSRPRYAVLEFDMMPLEDQACFFAGVIRTRALRLRSIVFSGSKSLHGIIETGLDDAEGFPHFKRCLDAMLAPESLPRLQRADRACWNLGRLTRLAGAVRVDDSGKKTPQALLWLA